MAEMSSSLPLSSASSDKLGRVTRRIVGEVSPSYAPVRPQARLISIVGSKKSHNRAQLLVDLNNELTDRKRPVLRYTVPESGEQPPDLRDWIEDQTKGLSQVRFVRDRTVAFASTMDAVVRQLAGSSAPTLIIDGFDRLSPEARKEIEAELVVPFLFPPSGEASTTVVIARDETHPLNEAMLRWEEEVIQVDENGTEAPSSDSPLTG